MGVIVLRPDALLKEGGNRAVVGAATPLAALSDNSDTSYERQNGAVSWSANFRFPRPVLPAGAVVEYARLYIRYSNAHYLNDFEMIQPETILVGRPQGGSVRFYTFTYSEHPMLWAESSAIFEFLGPPRVQGGNGLYLGKLLNDIPDAFFYGGIHTVRNTAWNQARVYSFELHIRYNEKPVVTLLNPTGTVTVARPPFAWNFSDPDGDTQIYARARIFTQAQTQQPGFSPDTTPPVYGEDVWTTTPFWTPKRPIAGNGNYVAYLRAGQRNISGVPVMSDWDQESFALNVATPAVPVVTADYEADVNAFHVHADGGTTGTFTDRSIDLQRSLDGGVTWIEVPASEVYYDEIDNVLHWYDFKLSSGQEVQYRARQEALNAIRDPVASVFSTPLLRTMPTFTRWWLRNINTVVASGDPHPHVLSMPIRVRSFSMKRENPLTTGYGLDDEFATVSGDGMKGPTMELEVDLLEEDDYDTFEAMIESNQTLLLQDVLGRSWYVRVGPSVDYEMLRAVARPSEPYPIRHAHTVMLSLISVGDPVG